MSGNASVDEVIRARRSVRAYRDDTPDPALVDEVVELASWAPSASNRQDWRFTVVTSADVKRSMAEAVRARWARIVDDNAESGLIAEVREYAAAFDRFEGAPVVIAVSARIPEAFQRHLLGDDARAVVGGAASAAMATQNLCLAASARGLGTCCMTGAVAAADELGALLGIGRKEELVCLVTLGWPAEEPSPPPRKPLERIRTWVR